MSLQKISAVTVIALSLAACGGGGGGTPSAQPTDTNIENTKAEEARKAEAARKAEEARIAQKTAELIEQAKAKGLNDDEAKQFAQNNINNEDDVSKANLDNMIKIKDLTKLAIAEGLNEYQAADFAKK